MKVTKLKENQLLFEDDCFKSFNLEAETKAIPLGTEMDEMYSAMLLGYRLPGMSSSKQLLYGNKISMLALFTSMVESSKRHGAFTNKDIDSLIETLELVKTLGE